MSPTEIIERAAEDGVLLVLSPTGSICAKGVPSAIDRWLPTLWQSKADIVRLLRPAAIADSFPWRDHYAARLARWFHNDRRWEEAERLAYGEVILEWHRRHGACLDPRRCAGCDEDLPDFAGIVVDRGDVRVHFDAVRRNDCIIAFGQKWRGAAVAGLTLLGLAPPFEFELL